nr:unnamed protein product [Callosobruchus chinensis]
MVEVQQDDLMRREQEEREGKYLLTTTARVKKEKVPFFASSAHEIRTDNLNHLPVVHGERQRCKYPECKGKPQIS